MFAAGETVRVKDEWPETPARSTSAPRIMCAA